jgi:hypothetical protein
VLVFEFRRVSGLGLVDESGGEVGFPGKFGGMGVEPVPAFGDGGFDVRDPVNGSFGVVEPISGPFEVGGGSGPVLLEPVEVRRLGVDPALGGGDGVVVEAAEAGGVG